LKSMSLIVNHVKYIYDIDAKEAVYALDDVSLEIGEGEILGIIGHTGSGKSTLTQMLNGLLKPTKGGVYYNGVDINGQGYDRKALRCKVGLVFQYPEHQLFESDVFTDVCFGPKNQGLSQKEVELKAYEALRLVGLEKEYYYQSPFDLSGGQKRKVAIAGVLAMKPEILILDEPTAGLDPKGRDEILSLLADIQKDTRMSIVLVSHSMEDVANYVDRLVVMNRGKIMYDDTPRSVFSHVKELEEAGLAIPQVSYIMRGLAQKGLAVDTQAINVKEAAESIYNTVFKK